MKPQRVRPRRRLLNLRIIKATIKTRLITIASLMVPVLDMRIVQILHNHALTVWRVDARLVAGETACLMHGRLTRAVGLRVACQVDVGAALFFGEAVASFGDGVGTGVALIFDHGLLCCQPCGWFEDGCC